MKALLSQGLCLCRATQRLLLETREDVWRVRVRDAARAVREGKDLKSVLMKNSARNNWSDMFAALSSYSAGARGRGDPGTRHR